MEPTATTQYQLVRDPLHPNYVIAIEYFGGTPIAYSGPLTPDEQAQIIEHPHLLETVGYEWTPDAAPWGEPDPYLWHLDPITEHTIR